MRTRFITMAALVTAGAMTLQAQAPAPQQTPAPQQMPAPQPGDTTQRTADGPRAADPQRATATQAITITGCLKAEKDVPGLKPNPIERAGVTDDYILTNVRTAQGSQVSGLGVSERYEIEGIAEADLKKHLNHQVELTGTVTQTSPATADDAPDFQATSLKMLAATCPAQ